MIKLRALEILKIKGKTKYWLYKQMGMSYQNFTKMIGLTSIDWTEKVEQR